MKLYPRAYYCWGDRAEVSNVVVEHRRSVGMDLWSHLNYLAREELSCSRPLECKIQGVLEPFKVRVISKGEALPYYMARNLQKILHDSLSKFPCFRLIKRPLSPTDLIDLSEYWGAAHQSREMHWFSVDYSAATDGLSWKYGSRILRYLFDFVDEPTRRLALRVLGPHNLWYDSDPAEHSHGLTQWENWGMQTNGQLMGSILSFPILCLANLGVYLATTSIEHCWDNVILSNNHRLRLVLVNGDDMVYCAPPELWERHVKISQDVGLKMSVGKAYHHDSYLNINSTSIVLDLKRRPKVKWYDGALPKQINFLNTGLFFGVHKVQGKDEVKETAEAHDGVKSSIIANANTLLSGSLPGKECVLLGRFLTQNKEAIRDETLAEVVIQHGKKTVRSLFTRNIFLPISIGGMGVVPPEGWKYRIKRIDLVLAKNLAKQYPDIPITTQLPLPGFEVLSVVGSHCAPCEKIQKESLDRPVFILRHPGRYTKKTLPRTGIRRYSLTQNTLFSDRPRERRVFRPPPLDLEPAVNNYSRPEYRLFDGLGVDKRDFNTMVALKSITLKSVSGALSCGG